MIRIGHAPGFALLWIGVMWLAACQTNTVRLEPEERLAHEIRPAVVRVNVFVTARFTYSADDIRAIGKIVAKDIPGAFVRRLSGVPREELDTGSGVSGSGVIINPSGFILTSAHVASAVDDKVAVERSIRRNGAAAALVRHFSAEPLRQLEREEKLDGLIDRLARSGSLVEVSYVRDVELANGERFDFEKRRMPPEADEVDVAIVRIGRRNLPSARVGDSAPVRVDDAVWVVGYPSVISVRDEVVGGWLLRDAEIESTLNPGVITSIDRGAEGHSRLLTNAAIYGGNAGGPAISRGDGSVVGMAMSAETGDTAKQIVPIDVVKTIVADAGVVFDDGGDFQTSFRAALDKIERGDLLAAKGELAFASQLFPNYPDLVRLTAQVEQLEQPKGGSRPSALVVGLLSFAVLLLAVIAVQFAVRARATTLEPPPIPRITRESYVAPSSRDGFDRVPDTSGAVLGRLTVLNGDRAGERIGLGGSGIRVGREIEVCEIVLENPKVSRLHAEFVEMEGRVLLIDRHSSNGTYVNDRKIDKSFLEDGDIIYFGGRNAIAVAFNS